MRLKFFLVFDIALILSLYAVVYANAQDDSTATVFFPQTHHEFAPVLDGSKVVHDFVIQNKGTATLNVERVKTG